MISIEIWAQITLELHTLLVTCTEKLTYTRYIQNTMRNCAPLLDATLYVHDEHEKQGCTFVMH